MPLAVVYRRQVGRDLAAGFDYYAGQGPGLGEKFLTAVTGVFDAIGRYRIEARRVVVLAVLHTARDPRLWPRPRREVE
jgi:plasmid stabilization system protein ParE